MVKAAVPEAEDSEQLRWEQSSRCCRPPPSRPPRSCSGSARACTAGGFCRARLATRRAKEQSFPPAGELRQGRAASERSPAGTCGARASSSRDACCGGEGTRRRESGKAPDGGHQRRELGRAPGGGHPRREPGRAPGGGRWREHQAAGVGIDLGFEGGDRSWESGPWPRGGAVFFTNGPGDRFGGGWGGEGKHGNRLKF